MFYGMDQFSMYLLVFKSLISKLDCGEQVFHVCILCRLATEPSDRWALLHPKISELVAANNYIGLYMV